MPLAPRPALRSAFEIEEAPVLKHLAGHTFLEVAQWLFAHANFVLIGVCACMCELHVKQRHRECTAENNAAGWAWMRVVHVQA